jgi:hypothetical protein
MVMAIFSKLWEKFLNFCYDWYDVQEDCLFFLADVKNLQYKHLSPETRKLIFFTDINPTEYVHYLNEVAEQQQENLQSVFDMFTSVGFTLSQAETLVNLLCTKGCSLQNRQRLITLYEKILLIAPFAQKNAFKTEDRYQKRLEQALIEFNLHVQNILCGEGIEITRREKNIEKLLANNLLLDHQDQITTHLIKSAGCIQPDIHIQVGQEKEEESKPLIQQQQDEQEKKKPKCKKAILSS